jgi:hypothetical protein
MEHTTQFLQGMFAAYIGCEVMLDNGQVKKIEGVGRGRVDLPSGISSMNLTRKFTEVKPILTPLSEITDEDVVEVAKIMLKKEDDWIPVRIERNKAYIEVVTKEELDITDEETIITMLVRFWEHDNKIAWIWEYKKRNNVGIDDKRVPNFEKIFLSFATILLNHLFKYK